VQHKAQKEGGGSVASLKGKEEGGNKKGQKSSRFGGRDESRRKGGKNKE